MSTVLVTGGCGSIGSLVVGRLILRGCTVRVLDNNEGELAKLSRGEKIRPMLGDVSDLERMKRATFGADWVIHCAALKHVSVCSYSPSEAVRVNVVGTQNTLLAAHDSGVKYFTMVSTDKACNPTTTMGASKLLAERIVEDLTWSRMECRVVRLGNVLGTRGSLWDIVNRVASQNSSVPITDPSMTRFLLTPDEAVDAIVDGFSPEEMKSVDTETYARCLWEVLGKGEMGMQVIGPWRWEKTHEEIEVGGRVYSSRDAERWRVSDLVGAIAEEKRRKDGGEWSV